VVSSAGFLPGGHEVAEEVLAVLAERGVPSEGLTSSAQVTPVHLRRADLVVTMARHHVREAAVLDPRSFRQTFTLKDIVRRGHAVRARQAGEPMSEWLEAVAEDRTPHDLLGDTPDDDVADPVGLPLRTFRKTANELERLTAELCDLAWPPGVRATREMTG
jgi:protein-tyrosine phosphatase